jgi:dCTP deaminase
MILSDREIKLSLIREHVRITPLPAADCFSSMAIDLTLDEELSRWKPSENLAKGQRLIVSPNAPGFDVTALQSEYGETFRIPAEGLILEPWAFLLGWTVEQIQLPPSSRLAARVEGRSSLARLGLGVHVTAPIIHAGFGYTGDSAYVGTRIRLEIWNFGCFGIRLERGMKICQLVLEEVHGTPEKGYQGVFARQAPEGVPPAPPVAETGKRKRRRR